MNATGIGLRKGADVALTLWIVRVATVTIGSPALPDVHRRNSPHDV